MSPCSRMCVCVSIKPGRQVERERSITSAPVGTDAATSLIFPSSTTITAFFRSESPRPSNKFPHCKATVFAADVCAPTIKDAAVATTQPIAAILRIMIFSNGATPLLIVFVFIFRFFHGFYHSRHHLERGVALLFEFGMRQRLSRQH